MQSYSFQGLECLPKVIILPTMEAKVDLDKCAVQYFKINTLIL